MDVFNLAARLTLDSSDYDKGLSDASDNTSNFGSKLKSGLATAGKAAVAGITAAGAAVGKITKDAIDGYADYEQLVGGIETLYEDLSYDVGLYAAEAYKTAGLSANEYMETAIGFAASLNNSLIESDGNISRSADLTNQIIVDMSDNVNKMGTTMESVQNAYRGFSRGNFTMLDNLALGFAGTKEGMQELLDKAQEISGIEFNIDSFADIAEAIHIVQEDMGIAGTTAKEASETISGSLASMKSSWQNLVVGMADEEADISSLVSNFADSVGTAAENIIPRVQQALEGIGKVVEALAPVIVESIPVLVENVLPTLLESAVSLLLSVSNAIIDSLPVIVDTGIEIIMTLANELINQLPTLIEAAFQMIMSIVQGLIDNLPELIPAAIDVILEIIDTLTDPNNLGMLIDAAIAIMLALTNGIIDAIPKLIERAPEIVENLVTALVENAPKLLKASLEIIVSLVEGLFENLPQVFEAGGKIVAEIIAGIGEAISGLWNAGKEAIQSVKDGFDNLNPLEWGQDLIENFVSGITEKWEKIKGGVSGVAQTIKDLLGFSEPKEGPLSDFHTYAPDMMELFAKGIRDNERLITGQIEKSFDFGDMTIGTARIKTEAVSEYGSRYDDDYRGYSADDLADAIRYALAGVGVYMDGQKVGILVTNYQRSNARAYGR